jgi:thioredoxin-dependent peroxiredoxin
MKRATTVRTWLLGAALVVLSAVLFGCPPPQRPDGGTGLLPVGALAPDLAGQDQNGKEHRLRQDAAAPTAPTVVYFYPMDGTPGCTKEACAFRDAWKKYEAAGVRLYGVSSDDVESHKGFATKHELPFTLIADPEHKWATAFGVSVTLGMFSRVSFLIGPDGKVAKVYPDVDPGIHADEVLADAKALPH